MIYFVTKNIEYYTKTIDVKLFDDIAIVTPELGKVLYMSKLGKVKVQAIDIEANGLDPYLTQPLLYGVGTEKIQFMFDWTVEVSWLFEHIIKYNIIALGHNLKYDIKIIKAHTGNSIIKLYDTMIVDQRLWMKSGYEWSYEALVKRYCKLAIIKSVRNEFIDVNIETFKITYAHLHYLKGDLVNLFKIRKEQRRLIKKFNMELLIYGIELPLVSIIAKAELTGFTLNTESWLKRIEKEKQTKLDCEKGMDEHVLFVGSSLMKNIPKHLIPHSKYGLERKHNSQYDIFLSDGTTTEINLFGENASHRDITRVKKKVVVDPRYVNWNSSKEVVYAFAALQEPLITPIDTFKVPQLDSKGKLIGKVSDYSLGEDQLTKYKLQKPNSIMIPFIELKMKHSKLITALGTFGENFIDKINKKTGKIHTSFRQCFTTTGRFQSGGGKKEPDKYNAQNIPREPEYRKAFTVDTTKYSVTTADYSGAELIVMASHAQDFELIALAADDMHSIIGTRCWRNIYGYRAKQLQKAIEGNPTLKTKALVEKYSELVEKCKTFEVTKKTKDLRDAFKPMTFGVIYGMYAKKAGETLGVVKEEGTIVIKTIEAIIPKTIRMVKQATADARNKGYVILNHRTNSRAWFPTLIKLLKQEINEEENFISISAEESEARNIRIQGTQADFVKEATVILENYFRKNRYDVTILSWVHDEIIFQVPRWMDGWSDEWKDYIKHNPNLKLNSPITGKEYNNMEAVIKDIMENVANRYLHNVTIQVDIHTENHWIK